MDEPAKWTAVNAEQFELLMVLLHELTAQLPDFNRKFRIVLEHDPNDKALEITLVYG